MSAERPWSMTVRVDDVPETGRHVAIEADEATRAALARPLGVDAVERIAATFDLARRGRDGLRVSGQVSATVRQTCVVSLEPVLNKIDEPVEAEFAPPQEVADPRDMELTASAAEEVEPLTGNSVDLGLIATEFLILAVDPYPRKSDAAFEAPAGDPSAHPFAALEGWNKKGTVKE